MSKDNKKARQKLERLYGKICMVEAANIRYIPVEQRRKIRGYTKYDDIITFHHIKEKSKGGKATVENGALVKGYNHRWINSLSEEDREKVNERLVEFKIMTLGITDKGLEVEDSATITPDILDEGFIEIPVFNTTKEDLEKREKFNRAKAKRDFQKKIDEYYNGEYDDDYEL